MARHQYIDALTGLRGFAAFWVFCHHARALAGFPAVELDLGGWQVNLAFFFNIGWAGVDIFFVLSGFLLSPPFVQWRLFDGPQPNLGRYLKRRVLRVFPAYWFELAVLLAVGGWFGIQRSLSGGELLAHAAMFFNIGPEPVRPLVGLWWTLPVELSFYLLLPLLAVVMRPRTWLLWIGLLLILSYLYRYWAAMHFLERPIPEVVLAVEQLPGKLPEFLLGTLAAYGVIRWKAVRPGIADGLVVVGAVLFWGYLWSIAAFGGNDYWRGHALLYWAPFANGAALALVIAGLYWGSRIGRWLFANRAVLFVGLVSYSFYLWHFPLIRKSTRLMDEHGWEVGFGIKFLLFLALSLLVSAFSYYWIERPFVKRRRPPVQPVST